MTSWKEFANEPVFRALSVALLHFLWQAAAIAGLYAAVDLAARRRGSPSTVRYALACGALALMVIAPLWSLSASRVFPRPKANLAEPNRSTAAAAAAAPAAGEAAIFTASGEAAVLALTGEAPSRLLATLSGWREEAEAIRPFCMAAWLVGVAALSLRLVLGWTVAARWTHHGAAPARPELVSAMERLSRRLALSRPVRLLESAVLDVPVALGLLKPAVLLPVSTLTGLSIRQIEALLAHELAHVRRNDYLVNLLQSAAETLFFFHPAVWWVSRRIRAERENCCDDLAVFATGDARVYAGALVDLEERRAGRTTLALAADGGDLLRRVARLFPSATGTVDTVARPAHARRGAAGAAGVAAIAALIVTGAALRVPRDGAAGAGMLALDPAGAPAAESAAPKESVERPAASAPHAAAARPAAGFVHASLAPETSTAKPTPQADEAQPPEETDDADTVVVAARAPSPSERGSASSPENRPEDATLTTDELRSLRIHNVTPEFVARIRALGYSRATVDELVSLRIHGVTPEQIGALQTLFGKISLDRAVEFAIHGVTPAFVADLRSAGLNVSAEQAVSMRIHGVTAEFVRSIRDAGFGDISSDAVVSLRIHGVDVAFVKEMRGLGFSTASLDELTSFRIHGVSPEFVRQVAAAGLSGLSADEVTSLRIHGVTPEFLRELKALKVALESADDATSLRIHGVTTSFIRNVEAEGYSTPTVEELTSLRIHGVSVDDIRKFNRAAGRRLPLDEVVEEKIDGGERSFE